MAITENYKLYNKSLTLIFPHVAITENFCIFSLKIIFPLLAHVLESIYIFVYKERKRKRKKKIKEKIKKKEKKIKEKKR